MKKLIFLIVVLFLFGCSNKNVNEIKNEENVSESVVENNLIKKESIEENHFLDFTVSTNYGEEFTLSKSVKPIFINFWATWCPPCVGEMPDLAKLCEEYKDRVDFIFVNCGDNEDEVKKCLDNMKINVPVGYDFDNKVGFLYQVTAIPATYIFDKNKKQFAKLVGARSEEEYRKLLEDLLKLE